MKKNIFLVLVLLMLTTAWQSVTAQQRRPIDSQHPLWLIHIDVWNSADPQKIIDLIPDDIKPYVCMNLSLSCQFDTETSMYRMPRNAVRTYKSWASVCQQNGMWFSCQPASGGHTHIQDNDLETFEYFFKTYPNFLGWNYAEQFWAFGDAGDMSSMTAASRWALFANLVEMSHKYGGFLTVSWCGGDYHMNTNPMGELKADKNFLAACKKYPEAILFLYKYTHASSFYNNESICWGPFVSGLTKNYGVRYDNCGWNDMTSKLIGENKCTYPGSAGIGTVMEQTCVNGGAVWDGPELIWHEECFQNLTDTNVDGYTRRNWGYFNNFRGIWLDMWRRIIDGTMYIPTREEVVNKTKIVVVNDLDISNGYDSYTSWDDLYDDVYLQTDPANQKKESRHNYGQWYNNLCYFKSTGRYGAIPIVMDLYDDAAKAIPLQVKRSNYTSRWGTLAKKEADFNEQYPEVSKGDLYVNRYRNQLVTYTPYTYLNAKKSASAEIPLKYNTCDSLKLEYGKLSSGVIREYADHIDFYLNNYRSDSTTTQADKITITGVTTEPTCTVNKTTLTGTTNIGHAYSTSDKKYDAEAKTFTITIKHMGPVTVKITCSGDATNRQTDILPAEALEQPKQPEPFKGPIIIEAEDMDRKRANVTLTNSGWWATNYKDFAGMGYVETQANTTCALRHQLKLAESGAYNIRVRYCNSDKAGNMEATINGSAQDISFEEVAINDWREAVVTATLDAGTNNLVLQNSDAIKMTIDQIIYEPVGTPKEKFNVKVRDADFGHVVADVDSAVAGQTVRLTITPEDGYGIKALNVVNSIFFTQGKTIPVEKGATEVSFVMPDDNVTIQPVFYDMAAIYELDFTDVAAGALPEGWRTTDGSDVRNYPSQNSSGPCTFTGLTGYQGKALYWRNTSAEYGRLSDYPLTLEPGNYKLTFAMAAWKQSPTYQVNILTSGGSNIKSSETLTANPNVNGNNSGDVSSAVLNTLDFEIKTKGNYVVKFLDNSTFDGSHEFLLLECKVDRTTSIIDTIPSVLEPYAVLTTDTTSVLSSDSTGVTYGKTLTFYYDDQKEVRNGMSVGPFFGYPDDYPAWHSSAGSITQAVFDVSFANCSSITSTAYWFYECSKLSQIEGIENLKTDSVTNMSNMFRDCSSLTNLDVSQFNTGNVTEMGPMFSGCSGLTSLDVSNFKTDNVTNMSGMFDDCSGLTTLDVSHFNTVNVKYMGSMFWGCSSLTTLDVSHFNTENVTYISGMFSGCSSLTSLDVSNFKTDNVTDMSGMFSSCSGLTSLDVSNFKTDNVTSMQSMFSGCTGLTSLDVSNFNTANVTNMERMFSGCTGLTSLDLSNFNTSKVTSMFTMFYDCSGLTSLDLSSFNTANVTSMQSMFLGCSGLTSLDLSNFNTENVTNMSWMFSNCSSLTSLDLSSFNTSNVKYEFDTNNYINYSFGIRSMFEGCSALTTIWVGDNWTTANLTESVDVFNYCAALVGGAGTHFDPDHVDYTYAHIDGGAANPGYFTRSGDAPYVAPEAEFDSNGVLAVGGSTTMTDALESVGGRDEVAKTITAIVWNSSATLSNSDLQGLDNPNLLIYVNEQSLAPQNRNNVVVNGLAMNVVLSDTGSGNCDFYAPQTFTAEMITYSREFKQATQVGVCRGWETIALPFMVQTIAHADNGVITPFGVDTSNKHFWLRQLSTNGLVSATKIEANLPYLISMPNDEKNYAKEYILKGLVTFSAQNAVVPKTEPTALALADSSIVMMPALQSVGKSSTVWALNVGQERSQYFEGSTFERDYREVRPFEAYTIHRSDTPAPRFLPINDLMNSATGIETISNVIMTHDNYYRLDGRKVDGKPTKKGLYITNGRKVVIK